MARPHPLLLHLHFAEAVCQANGAAIALLIGQRSPTGLRIIRSGAGVHPLAITTAVCLAAFLFLRLQI